MYTRVNWQDSPSTQTPMNAANLNVMDAHIKELDVSTEKLLDIYAAERLTNVEKEISDLETNVGNINRDSTLISNLLSPSRTEKQIGTYNGPMWFEKIIEVDESLMTGIKIYNAPISLSDILNVDDWGLGIITEIKGMVYETNYSYPIGYNGTVNGYSVSISTYIDEANKNLYLQTGGHGNTATILIKYIRIVV